MKQFLKQNAVFITLSLILLGVLGLALICIPKGDLHWLLCDRHTPARDIFYRYYTQIAEWLPYVICVIILIFGRIGDGVFSSAAQICSALTTQVFKHIVNAPRPITWFGMNYPEIQLPLTEGVRMNEWYSFPSGHTTSFFALFFTLSVILSNKYPKCAPYIQLVCFCLAALGGYSRIYLSQHFTLDVFAGVVVGVLITIVCYAVFHRFEGQKWYNYRLFAKK